MKRIAKIPAFNYAASSGLVPRGEAALYRTETGQLILRVTKGADPPIVVKLDRPDDVRAVAEEHSVPVEDLSALFRVAESHDDGARPFAAVARALVRGA